MARFDFDNMTLESAAAECFKVLGTPHGHNMIGMICNSVAKKFGQDEADKLFDKYQL